MSGGVPAGCPACGALPVDWVDDPYRATPTPPPSRDADVERVEPIDVLMDKRLIAEAVAKAMNPTRNLALNPLYVGDYAWRIATGVQDAFRAALQALGERG